LLVDQSSPIFFSSNVGEVVVDHSDIHDQTLKLSKIAPNFARFFALPNFRGAGFHKICTKLSYLPHGTSPGKVSRCYSRWPKVITANRLNFKPIFECSFLKIVGRTLVPGGCGLISLGCSLAYAKI